jgi:hypothetical protein
MSKYVGTSGYQSVIWHYKTDIDRNILDKWFINIFEQGVLVYTPDVVCIGTDILPIPVGTSFIIEEKTKTALIDPEERKIAKVDMVGDELLDLGGYGVGTTYNVIAKWENTASDTAGVDYEVLTNTELNDDYTASGYNYVKLGQVVLNGGGLISANNTTGITRASLFTGLVGWSGWSGQIGISGWSGYSSFSGASGKSGWSGLSGYSSDSGWSGVSGWSGASGVSGSGISGWSGAGGYDIAAGVAGKPEASEVVYLFIAPRAFNIPLNATGSQANCGTAPTSATKDFDVQQNGASIGVVRFSSGSNVGAFLTFTGNPTAFTTGQILKIVAPAAQDTTLADISITFLASL